jgi:fatty acid desaturase
MTTILNTPVRKTRASDYTALSKTIKEHKLLGRSVGFYLKTFSFWLIMLAATITASVFIQDSWWQVIPALLLGIIATQLAFLAHEASHRQVFATNKLNDRAGLFIANLFAGLSYNWWMTKHTRHHANPNHVEKDPDINIRALSFTSAQAKTKTGLLAWISKNQGWLFFPILTLTVFDLMISSSAVLFGKKPVKQRGLEIALFLTHYAVLIALPYIFFSPGIATAFIFIQLMSFGFYMGMAFAPNHKGMPVLAKDSKVDFLRRQVLTSRNIKGNWLMDHFMGGLNYQIEHHLFPNMARPSLKKAQELTKQYCEEKNIPYLETNLRESYRQVVAYLNTVGLHQVDPFDCPVVAAHRRRD